MNLRSINIAAKSFAARVCFAGLVALFSVATAVRADDCLNTTTTTAEPDFTPCEDTEPQLDLDAVLAEHAASATTTKGSDETPWIAQGSKGVPLTVNSTETGVSMRTSLATWRDYNVRDAMKTIDTSTPASPSDLILPSAPALPKSPLDIWSSVDVQGYQGSGSEAMRAGVGVDYKINRATTVGVLAERGDAKTAAGSGLEQDFEDGGLRDAASDADAIARRTNRMAGRQCRFCGEHRCCRDEHVLLRAAHQSFLCARRR